MLMYIDNLILIHKSDKRINNKIRQMKTVFKVENMGKVKDYLGVKLTWTPT